MNSKYYRKIGGALILILFLLACVSPLSRAPTSTAFPQAEAVKTLEVAVAETAAAARTQTATARPPTRTPTKTRVPSKTPTSGTVSPTFFFSLFTATFEFPVEETNAAINATATDLKSRGLIDLGGGFTVRITKKMWACYVRESPKLVVSPGKKFTASWTVVNTGTEHWTSNTIDFVYKGGYRHIGTRIQDLPSTVGSGRVFLISATFIAPRRGGEHHAYYVIRVDATRRTEFCPMWMSFEVK